MTISLSPDTVADSISKLSITGVTIKDIDQIPQSGSLILPVLFPQPNNWITDLLPQRQSLGTGGDEKMDFSYTLHYVFLFAEAGAGLSALDPISPMLAKLKLVWQTILTNDAVTGLVDMQLGSVDGFGIVADPSGKEYWGALFSLRCMEFAS